MTEAPLIAWSILVPLAGAVTALLTGPRGGRWAGLLTAPLALAAHLGLAVQVRAGGPVRHLVGGWGGPLGIDLLADGLSALMLLMTGVVGLLVTVYAFAYFEDHGDGGAAAQGDAARRRLLFWPLWLFLWAALAALFLTRDVFNVYVTLELVGLSAVALVALADEPAALSAAARYLVLALLGSLAYLLGVGLAYAGHATLDADGLRAALRPGLLTATVAALVGAGLCVKAAIFPLHGWLPPAHGGAPSPVSAVLSALVVKASFYLLVRWWGEILPGDGLAASSALLGTMGALAILWGSIQALRQERLKQVIAYSTVAQLGYLFLWFPLSRHLGAATALQGAALFALAHALAKASLFLAAGSVLHALHRDDLDALRGLGTRQPLTAATLALGTVSILALPPSGGFAAKWLLLSAALQAGAWWWVAVMLAGGLLAAGYSFRVLERIVSPGDDESPAPAPAPMALPAFALAVAALALGMAPWLPLGLLAAAPPLAGLGGGAP
jgi:formate hydrogenlyase subunit 3/multisubunit Na+/H+ antiporter MnhD subunit